MVRSFFLLLLTSVILGVAVPLHSYCQTCPYVFGEYLLWRPNEQGLAFALASNLAATPANPQLGVPRFRWSSGFRGGIGCRLPHDCFEVAVTWTGLWSRATGSLTRASTNAAIFPQWSNNISSSSAFAATSATPITSANGRWHLDLELLDGELARRCQVSPCLALVPSLGVRGAWIDQWYDVNYFGGINLAGTPVLEEKISMKSNFKGVGLRTGLGSKWGICGSLSLYGNAAVSLLYGRFSFRNNETQSTVALPSPVPLVTAKTNSHEVVPTLDLSGGIQWGCSLFRGCSYLLLGVGWEFTDFFDQNKFLRTIIAPISAVLQVYSLRFHEDLTMQGLVVSASLTF